MKEVEVKIAKVKTAAGMAQGTSRLPPVSEIYLLLTLLALVEKIHVLFQVVQHRFLVLRREFFVLPLGLAQPCG